MSLVLEKADQFRHIIRILNTNVEGKQRLAYGVRSIKGIGRRFAIQICKVYSFPSVGVATRLK
jgi:small subunit ribosomal protein S18e